MPTTITHIEGWDNSESWRTLPFSLPSGNIFDSDVGYLGQGKCFRIEFGNVVSLPYQMMTTNPVSGTTWFIFSGMYMHNGNGGSPSIQWANSGSTSGTAGISASRMGFGVDTTGQVRVQSIATSAFDPVGSNIIPANQWVHVEYHHRFGNASTGNWKLWINGRSIGTGVGDNSGVTPRFLLLTAGGPSSFAHAFYDNMVVAISDDANPAQIGPCLVQNLLPTSTSTQGWSGSDGNNVDNHLLVDDNQAASSDSVFATAGSNAYELYGHDPLPNAPIAVQVRAAVSVDSLGTDDFSLSLRSGAANVNRRISAGAGTAVWQNGNIIVNDPNTSVAWTKAGFDACTFGVKS